MANVVASTNAATQFEELPRTIQTRIGPSCPENSACEPAIIGYCFLLAGTWYWLNTLGIAMDSTRGKHAG